MNTWKSSPYLIEATAGSTLALCTCRQSSNPPYCDGTHGKAGTEKRPEIIRVTSDTRYYSCGCGKSGNGIWCDGSHKKA